MNTINPEFHLNMDPVAQAARKINEKLFGTKTEDNTEPKPEEWIWVDGYKGTDKNMCCKDYQYELGKQHDMPEDAKIYMCDSGFHFCLKLENVFAYYDIKDGNRFFKVSALIRKSDYDRYKNPSGFFFYPGDKFAAKSIIFTKELTVDEIFEATPYTDFTTEEKESAINIGVKAIKTLREVKDLVGLGYSEAFATYVCENCHYKEAVTFGNVPGLSMDVKVLMIFRNDL